jgi:hypothetical protein
MNYLGSGQEKLRNTAILEKTNKVHVNSCSMFRMVVRCSEQDGEHPPIVRLCDLADSLLSRALTIVWVGDGRRVLRCLPLIVHFRIACFIGSGSRSL